MKEEIKSRFERSDKTGFTLGQWSEVKLTIDGDSGRVDIQYGFFHKDATTIYPGISYPGNGDWGFSSISTSAEKAREIYLYNCKMLMEDV